jgi:hypothetical protein
MDDQTMQQMRDALDAGDTERAAQLQREWLERTGEGERRATESREREQREWTEAMSRRGSMRQRRGGQG